MAGWGSAVGVGIALAVQFGIRRRSGPRRSPAGDDFWSIAVWGPIRVSHLRANDGNTRRLVDASTERAPATI